MIKRTALVLVLLACAAALWAQGLPPAISSYYQDWNYVVRNSTGPQRQVLWKAYRRKETAVLTGAEQELLVRMSRVAEATDSRHYSMPMLLAGSASPVTSELLLPTGHRAVGRTRLVVRLRVLQPPADSAVPAGRSIGRLFQRKPEYLTMCRYTDEWTFRGGRWRVLRSPLVWVTVTPGD